MECVALQFMYKIDTNQIQVGDDREGRLLKLMLSKISNELWGLAGSLRYASYYSSFHHARSILESYATLAYIFSDSLKQEKRIRKFSEFEDVYKLNHYRECKEKLESGDIGKDEFNKRCQVSEEEVEELEEKEDEWIDLYDAPNGDISNVKNWYKPANITNLFHFTESPEYLREIYDSLSKGTHFTPFGYNLTGGFFLMGYPMEEDGISIDAIDRVVNTALLSMSYLDNLMREEIGLDFELEFESFPKEGA